MKINLKLFFLFSLFLIQSVSFAQVKIRELPSYDLGVIDSVFFNVTKSRPIIPLKNTWKVFTADAPNKKVPLSIPFIFDRSDELQLENQLNFTKEEILNNRIKLVFLGLNYYAEILINDLVIYKHPGGEIPFSIEIPKDVLKISSSNRIIIKISYKLDSENTIPLKQRFLFPENFGGIFRDLYLQFVPNTSISDYSISYTLSDNLQKAKINSAVKIEKLGNTDASEGASLLTNNYRINFSLSLSDSYLEAVKTDWNFVLKQNETAGKNLTVDLANSYLWSPTSSVNYIARIRLFENKRLIDEVFQPVIFYTLRTEKDKIFLNDKIFSFIGTTYYHSGPELGNLVNFSNLTADLRQIKELGFNIVRFAKSVPHPYALRLCEKMGLLAFVEIPLNSVPEDFTESEYFNDRTVSYLKRFVNVYKSYPAVAAIGTGSSYLSDSPIHSKFISKLADIVKKNSYKLSYASFIGFPQNLIENLDLYGIELYAKPISAITEDYLNTRKIIGNEKLFISEATYPSIFNNGNGYLNPYTFEAQAKYFEDLIDFNRKNRNSGFFINSIFDFRGDFASLFAGYRENNVYSVGILGEGRERSRLSYSVIHSKLNMGEKVTIPIGSKADDGPLFFIIVGLILSVIMAITINSKRKFREDATRALMRPYNFYSDVRDHRILSGFHSNLLMFILGGSHSLLLTNLLYFLKNNLLLEKFLLSFGSPTLLNIFSFLAWNPLQAFIYLFIFSVLLFPILTLIIKTASLFIKTKVMLSSIYYITIWAFLPLAILLPVELVLYRILEADVVNIYIYIFLCVSALWLFQRLIKGIFVIFDVRPATVYLYSFIFILVVGGGLLFYFQLTESLFNNIIMAIKQYRLL